MPLDIRVQRDGDTARILLAGHFQAQARDAFSRSWSLLLREQGLATIEVDFEGVDYMDSAALGMLLQLRDSCASGGRKLLIRHCHGLVRRLLQVANADRYMDIR